MPEPPPVPPDRRFVSRAGLKLEHALNEFQLPVAGLRCADFGCNVGGFTDCLLQRGAASVHAIDTGYNVLAYSLRRDPRVIVRERTNALHAEPPDEGVDLVAVDLAWTQQRHAIPAAVKWLAPVRGDASNPRIVTLIKPHYELDEREKTSLLHEGRLDPAEAERVLLRVLDELPQWAKPLKWTRSPLTGGKSSKGSKGGASSGGNVEFLALLEPLFSPVQEP